MVKSHGQRPAVLLALIVSFLLVLSYCLYQVMTYSPKYVQTLNPVSLNLS